MAEVRGSLNQQVKYKEDKAPQEVQGTVVDELLEAKFQAGGIEELQGCTVEATVHKCLQQGAKVAASGRSALGVYVVSKDPLSCKVHVARCDERSWCGWAWSRSELLETTDQPPEGCDRCRKCFGIALGG